MPRAQAVCIIETDIELDFAAPLDYVEPVRPAKSPSPMASPMNKSPILQPMGAPVLDGDSSEEDEAIPTFTGSGFRLDGKAIKAPKSSPGGGSSAGGALSGGAPTRLGVRIGPSGEVVAGGNGHALGSGPAPAPAAGNGGASQAMAGMKVLNAPAASASASNDYWEKMSGGNTLR